MSTTQAREHSNRQAPQAAQASGSSATSELPALLLGAGFALASLILLPAVAQRVGLGSSLTIALRGALMRAANRV
jgi:hypothetical protein